MSIFRNGDTWRAKVFLNGKVVSSKSGFATKRLAKEWHDEQRHAFGDNRVAKPERTFAELLEKYKADHLGKQSAGTQQRYGVEIAQRIAPFFRYDPAQPSLDRLDAFRDQLGRECKPRQANYCMALLAAILERGVRWRWLEKGHSFEMFEAPRSSFRWWDDRAHISRFLQMCKSRTRFHNLYYLALATGMREGEIAGLWKTDIDFGTGRITVQRQWDWAARDFALPKHGKIRHLDFDPKGDLAAVLTGAVAASKHAQLVFPSERGNALNRGCFTQKVFKAMQKAADVPQLSFHGLRHGFASWYMMQHDNIWALKEILGHADIKTTMRYAHHSAKLRKTPLDLRSVIAPKSPTASDSLVVGL